MKKIANQVAVATLLYTVSPREQVVIDDASSNFIQHLTVDDILHNYKHEKIARAAIHHTSVTGDGKLALSIDTSRETY